MKEVMESALASELFHFSYFSAWSKKLNDWNFNQSNEYVRVDLQTKIWDML